VTTRLSRRRLLGAATGGGLALASVGVGVRPAWAATDDELAYANFGLAASFLAADYYLRAAESGKLGAGARPTLRSNRAGSLAQARALGDLVTGAGDTPAAAEDFDFAWPTNAFATAANARRTGLAVLRTTLGAYQSAAAKVAMPRYRVLYASLGRQIGALADPAGARLEPCPVAMELEAASAALVSYLG
jgi:hypothetical protein